jgi:hypothetical protein
MNDSKTPWPSVAVGFETLPPIALSPDCRDAIRAAFAQHRKLNKGPRQRLFRALEIALARYETNKKIRGDSDRELAWKQIENLRSAAKQLRQQHLESLSVVAKMELSKANEASDDPSSITEMILATGQIERAADKALATRSAYSRQQQFHQHQLVCDVGECLADLTEGKMSAEGDPDVEDPDITAEERGLLADVFRALLKEREGAAPRYPRRNLRQGLDRLIELRRLERRADQDQLDGVDHGAVAELSPIDRMKDALARDDEA